MSFALGPRQLAKRLLRPFRDSRERAVLDPYDEAGRARALGLRRASVHRRELTPGNIGDIWGAARFLIDLICRHPDLRRRFPRALSEGRAGEFCRWILQPAEDAPGLAPAARDWVEACLALAPGRRIRRIYEQRVDLREAFRLALLPPGYGAFLRWLDRYGRAECAFRTEEIWWFFLECAEDPARELARSFLLQPDWQEAVPDGLTVFGQQRLLDWMGRRYHAEFGYLAGRPELRPLTPVDELRLAYTANPRWRSAHPAAFRTEEGAAGFLAEQGQSGIGAAIAEMIRPGVNILGHFCHPSGLQSSVAALTRSLRSAGVSVSTRDVPVGVELDSEDRSGHLGLALYDITILHVQPLPYFEQSFRRAGMAQRRDAYRIAVWYWESDQLAPEWQQVARLVDEVWSATRYQTAIFSAALPVPVFTLPPGVALPVPAAKKRRDFGLPEDHYLFLFTFGMASVLERKNPFGLIAAFRRAFGREEPARLVIKTDGDRRFPEELRRLRSAASDAGVHLIADLYEREDLLALTAACDCYVSLHRSEGFGLTMIEAMLLGRPVIATRYSGNLDFMNDGNSLLVDAELTTLAQDIPPYRAGSVWAEPSIEQAAARMRWVYANREEARALGLKGKTELEATLSPAAAGEQMAERLEAIRDRRLGA